MEHTPTPWKAKKELLGYSMVSNWDVCFASLAENWNEKDVDFVIRAVNSHDELVEALRVVRAYFASEYNNGITKEDVLKSLAKATK